MRFQIHFSARLKGALGIKCNYTEVVEAADKNEAILKLYDKYEHVHISKCQVI